MPIMLRPHGKPKKIAYKLLGTPPAFSGKQDEKLRKQLLKQDTWRMR